MDKLDQFELCGNNKNGLKKEGKKYTIKNDVMLLL